MIKEIWRNIPGYEKLYQASSCGRIKSFPRQGTRGGILSQNKLIGSRNDSIQYLYVTLTKGCISTKKFVHSIILISFIGNSNKGEQCIHKDNDIYNNYSNNLAWTLNRPRKLKIEQVKKIKKDKRISTIIARDYNVSCTTIKQIKSGKAWKHIIID